MQRIISNTSLPQYYYILKIPSLDDLSHRLHPFFYKLTRLSQAMAVVSSSDPEGRAIPG